ncbi:Spy/CpxP family protein refolding chaperone [Simiduia agarivorans]|uniref:Periplasmic protein CpxP n=1 Tax=Simiduia agarivorans (strain DSM 21679 / JCM 13881 / BCRC 17597 / SA1) TaxID=1117647 RepID=K4KHF6_SIMAS|nr:Spy/CpxP family protein refolding chaperone [Simiduia agarivorans]AFU97388.1 putative periplasmic protein CpxP [Simiduia agarivorans SA1 = DSM 21679]
MNVQGNVKRWVVAATLVALGGMASVAVAKGDPFGMHGPALGEKMIKKLELTEAQQEQARAMRDKYRADHKAAREQMKAQMKQFKVLERAGASVAELKAQADVMAALMSEKMVERAVQMREFRAILTAEQLVKMDELIEQRHQKHEAKMKQRHEKMAEREKSAE